MKNYYKILKVKENASEEEIRARWIKWMQKLHPDQRIEKKEDKRLKEINEAYQVLKHSSTRVEYDLKRRSYLRKKRGFYLRRLPLPVSILIIFLILGAIYFRRPLLSIQDTSLTQNQTNQIDQINQRNERDRIDQINQKNLTIPVPKSEKPVKVQKIVPKDLKKIPPKEFKEVKPQEIKPQEIKAQEIKPQQVKPQEVVKVVPTVVEPQLASPSRLEAETKSFDKPSELIAMVKKPVQDETIKVAETPVRKTEDTKPPEQEARVVPTPPLSKTDKINQRNEISQKDQRAVRSEKPVPKESIKVEETKPPEQETKVVSVPSPPQTDQVKQTDSTLKLDEPKSPVEVTIPTAPTEVEAQAAKFVSPPLIAKEEEVRQFLADYIKKYTQKDIDGFLSLFSLKAVQNQKDRFEGIRKIYVKFFNQSQELRYSMEDVKIEIYQNAIEVKARYEVDQILKKEGKKKVWKGHIRWVLAKENGALKILSLDYQHQKSL